MEPVWVTGAGVVTALGHDLEQWWERLCGGTAATRRATRIDTAGIGRDMACEVPNEDWQAQLTRAERRQCGRAAGYMLAAARQATPKRLPYAKARIAVVIGTSMGEAETLGDGQRAWFHGRLETQSPFEALRYSASLLATQVAGAIGAEGPTFVVPGACAAGNYAIGLAAELIRSGQADAAFAGASEVIERLQYAGFARLGAMAPERCQPFDLNRKGLIIGEGAAGVFLERAALSDAEPWCAVGQLGLSCDAFHITRPDPEGLGSERAIKAALSRSGLSEDAVGYLCAHGTGTAANDAIEGAVVRRIFGDTPPLVSSLKGALGHCMGAASAIEAVACVQTVRTGMVPPTVNLETPDPEIPIEVVRGEAVRNPKPVALNNALAFGGYNAALPFIEASGRLR